MNAEISLHKFGNRYSAHLDKLDGKSFIITPVYRSFWKERAYKKATKNARKIAANWAVEEKRSISL